MKKRNKTYKKRLTKHKKKFYTELALIITTTLAIAIISAVDHNFVITPIEASLNVYNTPLNVFPEETTPIKDYVLKEVYRAGLNPDEADKIINCESKWNTQAHAVNWSNKAGVDRGLWQISSLHHKEVSNTCAYDYICSTKEAIRIAKARGNWSAWSCARILGL